MKQGRVADRDMTNYWAEVISLIRDYGHMFTGSVLKLECMYPSLRGLVYFDSPDGSLHASSIVTGRQLVG